MTYWQTFKSNMRAALHHWSTWFITACTSLMTAWQLLPSATTAAILAAYPWLPIVALVVFVVVFPILKGLPQDPPKS